MKNIKKSIASGALTLAMVLTAIPATANAATTITNKGTYTTASITRTSSGASTVTISAKGTNNTASSKYIEVYAKSGDNYASARINGSSSGVVSGGSSKSAAGYGIDSGKHCYGVSVIHGGTSSSSATLESRRATN